MAVFEDFGLDPQFGESLTTDELEQLSKAHTFLVNLRTKYDAWKADPNHHTSQSSIDDYINDYGKRQTKEMADAANLRASMIWWFLDKDITSKTREISATIPTRAQKKGSAPWCGKNDKRGILKIEIMPKNKKVERLENLMKALYPKRSYGIVTNKGEVTMKCNGTFSDDELQDICRQIGAGLYDATISITFK